MMTRTDRPTGPHRRENRRGRDEACCLTRIVPPIPAAVLLLQTSTVAASGQEVSMTIDSITIAARALGILEADFHSVDNSFNIAFLVGIPVGFFGPFLFNELGEDLGLAAYVASPLFVGRALPASPESTPSSPSPLRFAQYGPKYQDVYEKAYRTRLAKRRRTASIMGSYLGAAVGVGGFIGWFFSNYD